MSTVPLWSKELGVPVSVEPVDLPAGTAATNYAAVVRRLLADHAAVGAVITSHKVGVFAAAARHCVYVSPDADVLRECNVLSAGDHGLSAHATDVRSIGSELDRIWPASAAPVVCLGAGGSGAALCLHLLRRRPAPRRIVVCERDPGRAGEFADLFGRVPRPPGVELLIEAGEGNWDDVVRDALPGGLVINATGLGKVDRANPLSESAVFPRHATVWDLNYRGPLPFLVLASQQADDRSLAVHDGLRLFARGWLAALATLLGTPESTELLDVFTAIAEEDGQ